MGEDLRRDGGDPAGGGGRERKREREFDDRDREPRDLRGDTRRRGHADGDVGGTRGTSSRGDGDLRRGEWERSSERKVRNFGIEREDDDSAARSSHRRGKRGDDF